LSLSLRIAVEGFPQFNIGAESSWRCFYAGRHTANKQAPAMLIPGQHKRPVSTSFDHFRQLNGSSRVFAFLDSHLMLSGTFFATLTTKAFDHSRLREASLLSLSASLISYAACCGTLISVTQALFGLETSKLCCKTLGIRAEGFAAE
jgi:hypothetical protein